MNSSRSRFSLSIARTTRPRSFSARCSAASAAVGERHVGERREQAAQPGELVRLGDDNRRLGPGASHQRRGLLAARRSRGDDECLFMLGVQGVQYPAPDVGELTRARDDVPGGSDRLRRGRRRVGGGQAPGHGLEGVTLDQARGRRSRLAGDDDPLRLLVALGHHRLERLRRFVIEQLGPGDHQQAESRRLKRRPTKESEGIEHADDQHLRRRQPEPLLGAGEAGDGKGPVDQDSEVDGAIGIRA